MPNKHQIRRSRSWRDLSGLMSKHLFGASDAPEVPLHRSSSFGRASPRGMIQKRTDTGVIYEFEIDDLGTDSPTIEEQRAKEREFQRRASTKRKVVPPTSVPKPNLHLNKDLPEVRSPAQTFAGSNNHKCPPSSSMGTVTQPAHLQAQSVSTAGHSRMASEMSIPIVLDFDLAQHQDNSSGSPIDRLDLRFNPTVTGRELSSEEKTDIIVNASPMHVVSLNKLDRRPSKASAWKRLFSFHKNENPIHSRRPSTSNSTSSSKRSPTLSSQGSTSHYNGTNNPKTIYTRPPLYRPPLSPPPSPKSTPHIPRSTPPQLSIQIPDSTMERASKIFQPVYAVHGNTQEGLGSQYGVPTPPSASAPSCRDIIHGPCTISQKLLSENLSATSVSERQTPSNRTVDCKLIPAAVIYSTTTQPDQGATACEPEKKPSGKKGTSIVAEQRRQLLHSASSSKRSSRTIITSTGKILTFPAPPGGKGFPEPELYLSDVDESDKEDQNESEFGSDYDDSYDDDYDDNDDDDYDVDYDDEWDAELVPHPVLAVSLKEPVWEMLTPSTKVIAA